MKMFACLAVAGLATSANADLIAYEAANLLEAASASSTAQSLGTSALANRTASGDTFTSETLIQTAGSAFFLDAGRDSVFSVGAPAASGGLSGAYMAPVDMVTVSADLDNGDGTRSILVETVAVDAAGSVVAWVPAGLAAGPGNPFVAWRMDVGSNAGGTDTIDIALNPGEFVNFLGSGFNAFTSAGAALGSFAMTLDNAAGNSASGLAVLGLGGADIAGFDVGSIQLFWTYEIVPAPASMALLGLGGLIAAGRRR